MEVKIKYADDEGQMEGAQRTRKRERVNGAGEKWKDVAEVKMQEASKGHEMFG